MYIYIIVDLLSGDGLIVLSGLLPGCSCSVFELEDWLTFPNVA